MIVLGANVQVMDRIAVRYLRLMLIYCSHVMTLACEYGYFQSCNVTLSYVFNHFASPGVS